MFLGLLLMCWKQSYWKSSSVLKGDVTENMTATQGCPLLFQGFRTKQASSDMRKELLSRLLPGPCRDHIHFFNFQVPLSVLTQTFQMTGLGG